MPFIHDVPRLQLMNSESVAVGELC